MRPVTICRPGNSFIMVLATHGSQKEPRGGKQASESVYVGCEKGQAKSN